jgi:hypothetical protein
VRDTCPLAFIVLNRLATVRQGGLERVLLAREVSFALVVDGGGEAGATLDGRGVGQLDIGRSPDDALNAELGYRSEEPCLSS